MLHSAFFVCYIMCDITYKDNSFFYIVQFGCISICRITLSYYWIALKGQKHQNRASPYYSGVSSQLALKG